MDFIINAILAALGVLAVQVAAAVGSTGAQPRVYPPPTPPTLPSPQPSAAMRRDAEAQWAARTGGMTGGALDAYLRDAVRHPAPETCTYRLNALHGMMVCVDGHGNVHAR